MVDYAKAAHPKECCGLLLGEECRVLKILPAANIAEDKHVRFEIDPAALLSVQKSEREGGAKLIGYYHSHPNGRLEPSQTDAAMAAQDGKYWLIIADGQLSAWVTSQKGRLHNRFDPVEMISKVETHGPSGH